MIDEFTRYGSAAIISSKTSAAKVFMKYWIAYFGLPKTIFSDNGGEFIGQSFLEMCEQFNIRVRTTSSKSPWGNGRCERHNQTLTTILLKIKDDVGFDYVTALSWAVSAKNTLYSYNEFTPSQLVFGSNATLPNFINNQLPAESEAKHPDIALHIAALHAARKEFMAAEANRKLKLALHKNTGDVLRPFEIGEEVFYKRDDQQEWKGPGTVLGQDGAVIFIRNGSHYIKAHSCRVQPKVQDDEQKPIPSSSANECHNQIENDKEKISESDDEISLRETDNSSTSNSTSNIKTNNNCISLKPNSHISFTTDKNEKCIALILSRAGKATGKYNTAYNIEYLQPNNLKGTRTWIDTKALSNLTINEPEKENMLTDQPMTEEVFVINSLDFTNAKQSELSGLKIKYTKS